MRSVWIACALVGIFIIVNVNRSDAVVFRLTNFVCESYNKSWVVFHNCRLKAISRSTVILNMNATILKAMNDITIRYKLYKKASGYKPWLLDSKIDGCRFMRSRNDPFIKWAYSFFRDFSNMNHTCPYVGPQIIQGLYLKLELLRLPLPTGDYKLLVQAFVDEIQKVEVNVSFAFVEDLMNSK